MSTPSPGKTRPTPPKGGKFPSGLPSSDVQSALPPHDDIPRRADATREKLLAATHELLRERVGGPVSVNEICARAGANVAMVKYCFGGKDAMIAALIERIVA